MLFTSSIHVRFHSYIYHFVMVQCRRQATYICRTCMCAHMHMQMAMPPCCTHAHVHGAMTVRLMILIFPTLHSFTLHTFCCRYKFLHLSLPTVPVLQNGAMAGRRKVSSTSWLLVAFTTAFGISCISTSTGSGQATDLRSRKSGSSHTNAAAGLAGHPPSLNVGVTTNEAWRRALQSFWDHGLSSAAFCLGGSRNDPSAMLALLADSFQIAAADPRQGEVCGNDTIIQGRLCSPSEIGEYYKVRYSTWMKSRFYPTLLP